ncbi:hypothetical protein EKD04_025610 [Chloroflexales bacterium ZM16-3]|nr:hypothetical protein [Chloroflexales bacterium ZM16-3]
MIELAVAGLVLLVFGLGYWIGQRQGRARYRDVLNQQTEQLLERTIAVEKLRRELEAYTGEKPRNGKH